MKRYNPTYHRRKYIRLKSYDYSQEGLYFVTICHLNRDPVFGRIENDKMVLNPIGQIIHNQWLNTPKIRKNCSIGKFCVMPNHFHLLISIDEKYNYEPQQNSFSSPKQSLGSIIRGFKSATTKEIRFWINQQKEKGERLKYPISNIDLSESIWKRGYYDRIIRSKEAYFAARQYIISNPKNWEEDEFFSR